MRGGPGLLDGLAVRPGRHRRQAQAVRQAADLHPGLRVGGLTCVQGGGLRAEGWGFGGRQAPWEARVQGLG